MRGASRASRIRTLCGGLALVALAAIGPGARAQAPTIAVAEAADFADAVGVNVHLYYLDTVYNDFALVTRSLNYLGVRHLRDRLTRGDVGLGRISALGAAGFRFNLIISQYELERAGGLAWSLGEVARRAGIVTAIEGPNESDIWPVTFEGRTGLGATRTVMAALREAVRATPAISHLPIVQASFAWPRTFAAVGDLTAHADLANTHTYFGWGTNPAATIAERIREARTVTNRPRVVTTETGYHNALGVTEHNVGVTEEVQAKYVLRILLEQFRHGVERTYIYELLDLDTAGSATNPELHWGLFRTDGTPKLAATGVRNLLRLLAGSGAPPTSATPPAYQVAAATSVHHLMLDRGDGTFALVLWNEVPSWNPAAASALAVAPAPVTVDFGPDVVVSGSVFDVLRSADTPVQAVSGAGRVALRVPDHPIVLELDAVGPRARDVTLRITGDAWNGAPEFRVLVDGRVVADRLRATARRSSGAWQDVVLDDVVTGAPRELVVEFLNDSYGGTPDRDRNLYVQHVVVDGVTIPAATGTGDVRRRAGGVAVFLWNASLRFDLRAALAAARPTN